VIAFSLLHMLPATVFSFYKRFFLDTQMPLYEQALFLEFKFVVAGSSAPRCA
jgi:hypothetical protein